MKIDVIDMDDPVLGTSRRRIVQPSGSTMIEMYGMCNGIGQMVRNIMEVATPGSIDVLRIWGHGWSGGQLIASGKNSQIGVDHGSALWRHNMPTFKGELTRLRSYFAPGGRVELKGCQVARGQEGENLLLSLARAFGVRVIAGVETQGGHRPWGRGDHWDGPLVEASPGGGLSCAAWTTL